MSIALFISPHLDDVAFSCGATLARLSADGWRTVLCTIFTGSVESPIGFALACQTDKGLPADVDYMALRRGEDEKVARILGASQIVHWPFVEAPHRGYNSAPELFAGVRADDEVWMEIVKPLRELLARERPDVAYLPQGIGGHVDHWQVIRAFLACDWKGHVRWYRDTPYIIRDPGAQRDALVLSLGREIAEEFSDDMLEKKIAACAAYRTQIGFQFGGEDGLREKLTALAASEASVMGSGGFAERFWETAEMQ